MRQTNVPGQVVDLAEIHKVKARRHLIDFIKYCRPGYIINWHHKIIAEYYEQLMFGDIKRLILSVPPQYGKDLALDTLIPTPTGFTAIGDLVVGDEVFDENGNICHVIAKSPVWKDKEVYDVTTNDGEHIIAGAEHLWNVRLDRKRPVFSLKTTEYLYNRTSPRRAMIKIQGALNLPESDLPLDPYVLGVWLGDGDSAGGGLTQSVEDAVWLLPELTRLGCTISKQSDPTHFGMLKMLPALRELNLIHNKHIPSKYLRASKEQRLSLLQGLIDTDGYVSPEGQVEFCNVNKTLAYGAYELISSLGIKATINEYDAK